MRQRWDIMGMPVVVELDDATADTAAFTEVYNFFCYVDNTFSTYKPDSEISRINRGEITAAACNPDVRAVLQKSFETTLATNGFFNICRPDGTIDPSGLVKGWAIHQAAKLLEHKGHKNFYVEAGGDIQTNGCNPQSRPWQIGIKNPFVTNEIIKIIQVSGQGVATSGTYLRGQHIYNPHNSKQLITDIVSLTVIAPTIYEADRFATAAFAMGKQGIYFIERQPGLEGYIIDCNGEATMTTGFDRFVTAY